MSEYLFFYGQANSNGFLSNFYRSTFEEDNILFDTVERYMHYHKALLFEDYTSANKILQAKTPLDTKRLGRKVKNFDPMTWNLNKKKIVKNGILLKFINNDKLKKKLLDTGDLTLVEASCGRNPDRIWGIGFSEKTALINKEKWGLNLLGEILMEIREFLER